MNWEYFLIPGVALVASMLTFISGFGLGTLLLPAFAVFYPAPLAVTATAVVHLINNLAKFALMARYTQKGVFLRFGIPALIAGLVGAWLLTYLGQLSPLLTYEFAGRLQAVLPVKLVIGLLMIGFAMIEFFPAFDQIELGIRWLAFGGILSGFFGGLSGHQGALRSAFLARTGLDGKQFIGTSVSIAVALDLVRLSVYLPTQAHGFHTLLAHGGESVILAAVAAALVGTAIGKSQVKKITIKSVRSVVAVLLFLLGGLLATGLI
jgi:uncharacterized membrane protein YfcA